jgi:hypothetical protein
MPLLSYKLGFFLATGENHENVQEGISIFLLRVCRYVHLHTFK